MVILYLRHGPWRLYLLLLNSLSLISFVLINFLPESPKFLLSIGKHDEAISILKKIHDTNFGKGKDVSCNIFVYHSCQIIITFNRCTQ